MNKDKQHNKLVPELRFSEFKKERAWEEMPFGNLCKFTRGPFGGALKKEIFVKDGFAVYEQRHAIHKDFNTFRYYITEGKYNELKRFSLQPDDLIMSCSGTMGKFAIIPKEAKKGIINQALLKLTVNKGYDLKFIKSTLELPLNQDKLLSQSAGGAIKNVVAVSEIKKIILYIPNPKEQQKIASCLSSLNNLIEAESEKLDILKDYKKGLLQQLFPAEGETVPQLRFSEFEKDGEWKEKELGECLDYLQPTPYLVSNTDYNDEFETPVLTAGKTFVLGYTDEKEGIFSENLPVIIFDDFTTATKFVDFPFKAKSSAMKILLAKDDANIKFVYETIQNLKYEVGVHKRHWISVFSKLKIVLPTNPKEQQKIANTLSSVDELITAQAEKIEALKEHKKGLMQGLFPNVNEMNV